MTQTIGQKLKAVREEKRLTFEKVFEDIRIRVTYLQALEADDLSVMPSPVQARGYLRNYAQYLELDFDQLLRELRAETQTTIEVLGPAEDASTLRPSLRLPENKKLNDQPATQPSDPVLTQEFEVPVEAFTPSPPGVPLEQVSVNVDQPHGRPGRRKKKDSQPVSFDVAQDRSDSVQPAKRRGRKKVETEPEPAPVVESTPELIEEPV